MEQRRFCQNELIIIEGQSGNHAWLIEEGQIQVFRVGEDGQFQTLATLGPGAIVGEMALIDDGVRSASARAMTDVVCKELNRSHFQQLINKSNPLAAYLLKSLVAEIRRSHGLPQDELIEGGADIRSMKGCHKLINRRTFYPGYVFFRQDDPASVAYLIQSGDVSITQQTPSGARELAVLGPGRVFGELALLTGALRSATAIVQTQAVCEILPKEAVTECLATMPPFLKALTRIYVKQITKQPVR